MVNRENVQLVLRFNPFLYWFLLLHGYAGNNSFQICGFSLKVIFFHIFVVVFFTFSLNFLDLLNKLYNDCLGFLFISL